MQKDAVAKLFDLNSKTALITGGSRGIGKSIAMGLANAGADVVIASRSADSLDDSLKSVVRSIKALGRQCHTYRLDVSDVSSIKQLFTSLDKEQITPDILINNAGIEQVCPSIEVDEALWDKIVDTNLKGAFFVAQQFARAVLDKQQQGSIINLGSLTSAVGVPTATAYTSSKSGILGMTRALSTEWSPLGIRVNAIGPGYFRTELTEAFYEDDAWQEAMLAKIPMNRFGDLDDLVGISVFLAGTGSSYVSGQIFYVDGGYLASI